MENFRFERVKKICEDLQGLITRQSAPITEFQMKEGFFLTPKEANDCPTPWRTFTCKSDVWSGPDAHFWFKTSFTVPKEYDNKPLWLSFITQVTFWDAVNPQFLLFINNEVVQGLDVNHKEVLVTNKAKAGDVISIDLQAYTGRDNDHNKGTSDNLRLSASVMEFDEQINELYYNLYTPNRIVGRLAEGDQSRIKLQLALEKAINLIDLRVPYSDEFYASVKECNDFVKNEIYGTLAGNDDVIATCIGHTHIDVAWWWTVEQTKEKVVRSFATVLKYMDEYKDYKFMSSQPQIYKYVKQRYPELYERIKDRVKEGRWETEGGMWLEADCNVTSGESLVRQFLYGKKFFKDEFNQDNKILWLPDVFGYSAALPQIMRKCDIDYFMTTKISWNQFNKLPMDTFNWRGIDGTEIFTHLITTQDEHQPENSFGTCYNGSLNPVSVMRAWERYQQKDLNNDVLICYGFGDGGGGPTREMVETGVRMEKGIVGAPKVRFDNSRKYFDELYERCGNNNDLPKWVGELYLEYHRGTYTSMARNKRSNRKCELMWQDVEYFSTLTKRLGITYQTELIDQSWETIMLNQFHDILPGSAIKDVYDVTKIEYAELEKTGTELIRSNIDALANAVNSKAGDLVVFNSLSFDRDDMVTVTNKDFANVTAFSDQEGNILPVSKTADGNICFTPIIVPAKGYAVFTPTADDTVGEERFVVSKSSIETPFYKVEFNANMEFTRLFDKDSQREVIKQGETANRLMVYEDKPIYYDNWDIDIYYQQKSWVLDNVVSCEWTEVSTARAVLEVNREFLQSKVTQKIVFYADNARIDFDTYVDWKQFNLLLKCEFPVDINASEATYDIQFGNLKRPTHKNTSWDGARFEVCAHKWADLSEGGYGVALLNDCKYGYAINDNVMTLSLVKSGIVPNPTTDQEEHFFTYALLPHATNSIEDVVKQGYCLNVPFYTSKTTNPTVTLKNDSFMSINCDNIIIETVKQPLEGNGTIVRMYEYQNKRTTATITLDTAISSVCECNLLEEKTCDTTHTGNEFSFEIKPFEIKTFRVI